MPSKYVKNPVNYLGNKNRMLDFIYSNFPKSIEIQNFVDVFCGTATVAVNSGVKKIFLNDINEYMIDFLEIFKTTPHYEIIKKVENIVKYYGLEQDTRVVLPTFKNNNIEAYNKLKTDFNKKFDIYKLLTLVFYGFNNQIRFNSRNEYNIPLGKSLFNDNKRKVIKEFCNEISGLNMELFKSEFIDFVENVLKKEEVKISNTFFYFDPPYLISNATYNSNWSEKMEEKLLKVLDNLNQKGFKFMLSNVLENKGMKNSMLFDWLNNNNFRVVEIDINYENSNYQRVRGKKTKEVLILNY